MKVTTEVRISTDPASCVLAVEASVRAICEATGKDPAEGVMMLLTAAAHMSAQYSDPGSSVNQRLAVLAEALGAATVAAEGFFKLRKASNDV